LLYCIDNPYYDPRDGHDPRAYRGRNRVRPVDPAY
jgi:hypothetical protein